MKSAPSDRASCVCLDPNHKPDSLTRNFDADLAESSRKQHSSGGDVPLTCCTDRMQRRGGALEPPEREYRFNFQAILQTERLRLGFSRLGIQMLNLNA